MTPEQFETLIETREHVRHIRTQLDAGEKRFDGLEGRVAALEKTWVRVAALVSGAAGLAVAIFHVVGLLLAR